MPGFSFPPVGPLGHGFPPSRPSYSGRRYYDQLRLPLHLLRSLRFALDPRYLACTRSFVFLSARRRARCRPSQRLAALVYRFACPGLSAARSWRSSQVPRLPLCVHAPLADPGGVLPFAITRSGLMPSSNHRLSAFPSEDGLSMLPYGPQLNYFRSSVTRPTHLLHLASHISCWICTQVRYRQGGYSRLTGLGRCFALTCWVTASNFTVSLPIPRIWI